MKSKLIKITVAAGSLLTSADALAAANAEATPVQGPYCSTAVSMVKVSLYISNSGIDIGVSASAMVIIRQIGRAHV